MIPMGLKGYHPLQFLHPSALTKQQNEFLHLIRLGSRNLYQKEQFPLMAYLREEQHLSDYHMNLSKTSLSWELKILRKQMLSFSSEEEWDLTLVQEEQRNLVHFLQTQLMQLSCLDQFLQPQRQLLQLA